MGERKGVNKYYPPDFDYKKHGSLDRYHNSHPLRERAKKISEGILVIRFEMPYNIWCNGCNKHIGMGVRYNSEKKKVGNYYSTPIYKFRMRCHLCEQYFEIQTDPANCEYVILSGARRKEERWDAKDNEQIEMTDHAVKKKLISDPMFKLEHGVQDKTKLEKVIPTLWEIQDLQDEKKDDYLLNKALRNNFRSEKKAMEKSQKEDDKLLTKASLDLKLLPESEEDKTQSKLIKLEATQVREQSKGERRRSIENEPIIKPSLEEFAKISAQIPQSIQNAITSSKLKSSIWDIPNGTKQTPIKKCKLLGITRKRKNLEDSDLKTNNTSVANIKTKIIPCKLIKNENDSGGTSKESAMNISTKSNVSNATVALVSYPSDSDISE